MDNFVSLGEFLLFGALMLVLSAVTAVAWYKIKRPGLRWTVTLSVLAVVLACSCFLISRAWG